MICVVPTRDHQTPKSIRVAAASSVTKLSVCRSIGLSLAAFIGFSLLLGAFAVPHEIVNIVQPQAVSIRNLIVDENENVLLAYCACVTRNNEAATYYQLSTQRLNQPTLDPEVVAEPRRPIRACPIAGGMIVAEEDGTIRRLSTADGANVIVGKHGPGRVWRMACSPDNRVLLTWDFGYVAWDLTTNQQLCRVPSDFRFALLSANPTTFICDDERSFIERDLITGEKLRVISSPGDVLTAALSPDGSQLATIGTNRRIQVSDVKTGVLLWESRLSGPASASRLLIPIIAPFIVFSPEGDRLLCAHEIEQYKRWGLSVWNTHKGALEMTFDAHSDRIAGAQFVGPRSVYTWADDCRLCKWQLQASHARLVNHWNTTGWRTYCD